MFISRDKFVIMPNHIHGILMLQETNAGTRHAVSLHEQFGKPIRGTVPTIVRSFKSAVTRQINILTKNFGAPVWKSRFFDRIIRDEKELNNIREYIANNVIQWASESSHERPDNLFQIKNHWQNTR